MKVTALIGGFRAEILHLLKARFFVALTIVQAVTFLFLVSLFGLTGSRAPTALIMEDQGYYAKEFVARLSTAFNSFDLRPMSKEAAQVALSRGEIACIITIPKDFSSRIVRGQDANLHVVVDNLNTDMTIDIQRALPSAVVAFGKQLNLPHLRVQVAEFDLIDHDTDFIPYLVVSGLALDAFVIACVLSAMVIAREFENGTIKLLAVAPVPMLVSLLGRVLATALVAAIAMIFPVTLTVFGYGVVPRHPFEVLGVILLCIAIFSCIGIVLGAVVKRTLPVASLVFGLSLPLYLCSNSFEPQRLDGNLVWILAHISPVYYAVGVIEQAFHDLHVTPEPTWLNFLILVGWALLTLPLAGLLLRRTMMQRVTDKREKRARGFALPGGVPVLPQRLIARLQRSWLLVVFLALLISSSVWLAVQYNDQVNASRRLQQAASVPIDAAKQETLLSNYTARISAMITRENLLRAKVGDEKRAIAESLTLTTLHQLDAKHKAVLFQYLYHTKLISMNFRAISLKGADLRGVQLANLELEDMDISGADFSGADLSGSDLSISLMVATNFSGANLVGADLSSSDLRDANLSNANMAEVNLTGVTGVTYPQLMKARSLESATIPDGLVTP